MVFDLGGVLIDSPLEWIRQYEEDVLCLPPGRHAINRVSI